MTKGTTIWAQLSRATKMQCGARQPITTKTGVQFTVGGDDRCRIIIDLLANDTYKVSYIRFTPKWNVVELACAMDVYVEQLNEIIYELMDGPTR